MILTCYYFSNKSQPDMHKQEIDEETCHLTHLIQLNRTFQNKMFDLHQIWKYDGEWDFAFSPPSNQVSFALPSNPQNEIVFIFLSTTSVPTSVGATPQSTHLPVLSKNDEREREKRARPESAAQTTQTLSPPSWLHDLDIEDLTLV